MASVRRILSGSQFSDEALSRRLTEWETRALDALRTQLGPEEFERATRFASRLPLHRLSTSVQASLMNDYRSIIGLDQVLTHFGYSGGTVDHKTLQIMGTKTGVSGDFLGRMGAMWGSLRTMRGINDPNPFGRMPFDIEEGSLIERIYSQLNVQWRPRVVQGVSGIADPKTTVAGPSRYFTVGRSSIPTMASINRPTSLPSFVGKKVAVFDIETAGLIPGQIRSLAVSDLVGDSTGRLIGRGRPTETVFRASEMRRGAAYWQGQFISTEEFVERRFGAKVSHLTGTGDEFASRMEPFLQKILDSDYIVGHNIAQFDIEQIFTSLAGTQRFKNDQKFAALVDEAYKQAREKTIDTLEIVRANKNLAGLTTHRAISEFGQAFSIENLLLRTNLATIIGLDELAAAMGYQDGIFTRGLHHADVDTLITRALLEHQDEIRIKRGGMKAGFTGDRAVLARRIEQSIIQSGAITPWSNIRDIEAIAPALRGMGPVSYMQQHIWSQRNLGMGIGMDPGIAPSPVEIAERINLFDRMKAKGIETVQQRLAAVNTPFAGLSMEERAFGTRLSRATASLAPDPQAARYATDALISHFHGFSPTDIQWMGYHGRATIDPRILADMGLLGGDSPQLLSMSAVDRTAAHDRRSVNLVMGLDDDQIQKLSARLTVLADDQDEFARILGLSGDDAVSAHRHFKNAMERGLIGQLTEHGRERGITIAQLHDNPGMVDEVFDLMRQFHITEQLRDKDTTQMALAFLGLEDDGTVRTTGSILNFGLDAVQMENIGRHVQLAATAEANARAVANDRTASTFANMLGKARTEEHADAIMRGIRAYTDVVRPNIGKISIGALGATAGLLLLARKREQDRFDVATDPMPAQQQNYAIAQHVANRMASPGFDGYRQQIDPLATASLVANLHANQLGHDNLRWDRNSNLYGGLL